MKNTAYAFATLALTLTPAIAQQDATGKLTVLQVINIADALRKLGDYQEPPTVTPDGRTVPGKRITVPYQFDGATRMTFAIDINHADAVQQVYEKARQDLITKMFGNRQEQLSDLRRAADNETDPTAKKQKNAQADAMQTEVNTITQKINEQVTSMLNAPASALLTKIKESDLCMASKPTPPCIATNQIPPSLLATMVPIIER